MDQAAENRFRRVHKGRVGPKRPENRIKKAGGDYYSNRKLWKLPYETAKNMGITKLIVKNA